MSGFAGMPGDAGGFLRRPFCRDDELMDIITALRAEDCRAVFLTSDSGLGASTILRKLVETAPKSMPVLSVTGSRSLTKVPFGALSPFLTGVGATSESIRVDVIRGILAEINRLRDNPATPNPGRFGDGRGEENKGGSFGWDYSDGNDLCLIVIDDAHAIDEGTAEAIVSLVMAGTVQVVASHSSRQNLPAPLAKLWQAGMAENIILEPLSQQQGHAFCEGVLGGPVVPATSWHYWQSAGGNPLFLHLLLTEAVEQGLLAKDRGVWAGEHKPPVHGPRLEDAVRTVLAGLSNQGKEALNLVALSEPLADSALRSLVPAAAVTELLDWPLVRYQPPESDLLVLANPIYGQVIRELVTVTKSRQLREQLISGIVEENNNKESLLRRVLWSLEVGVEVPDVMMLRAAVLATKMFQSATALELAGHIHGQEFKLRATMVKARAKYNQGDYHGAFLLMESLRDRAETVADLVFGSLLRASTRSALGMPVTTLMADARELRQVGGQLARDNPRKAGSIRAHSESAALMVELMALSRAGRYSEMTALTQLLTAQEGLPAVTNKLNLTIALTMDSERLTAQGFPLQGARRAAEAFAIEHSEENDVFFLPESILLRQLTAVLCAGDWSAASAVTSQFSLEAGPVVFSFGGGVSVVRGMALLRTGQDAQALDVLQAGLEALRLSDPQQLLGFCTAMAAYTAARLGKLDLAAQLAADHVDSTGMFVVLAHECAYLSAARHFLTSDGGALAELATQADTARAAGSSMLELNALVLMMELGDNSIAERVAKVAAGVEGPWAQGVGQLADALQRRNGNDLALVAEDLAAAGLHGLAQLASDKSARLNGNGRKMALKGRRNQWSRLGGGAQGADSSETPAPLTRREEEVAGLAAKGCSDREIADELTLAVRTVEGHLYRAYAKLGISTRDELGEAMTPVSSA